MEVSQMRAILKKQYRATPAWVDKVSKMSDKQVMAIYFRMLNEHRLVGSK